MLPKPNKTDAARLAHRLLPVEDWNDAPPPVREALAASDARGAAYDVNFGWCVIERTQEGPVVVMAERGTS